MADEPVSSDRVSDRAFALVSYFRAPAPDGLGWNNAPSPLNVQALIDGGISDEKIKSEYQHYVDDINGGDSYQAFEGNLHDRGQAVVQHLLRGVPYDTAAADTPGKGVADSILAPLIADYGRDRVIRALQKIVQNEPV